MDCPNCGSPMSPRSRCEKCGFDLIECFEPSPLPLALSQIGQVMMPCPSVYEHLKFDEKFLLRLVPIANLANLIDKEKRKRMHSWIDEYVKTKGPIHRRWRHNIIDILKTSDPQLRGITRLERLAVVLTHLLGDYLPRIKKY